MRGILVTWFANINAEVAGEKALASRGARIRPCGKIGRVLSFAGWCYNDGMSGRRTCVAEH